MKHLCDKGDLNYKFQESCTARALGVGPKWQQQKNNNNDHGDIEQLLQKLNFMIPTPWVVVLMTPMVVYKTMK
jgi:hypothetical protein